MQHRTARCWHGCTSQGTPKTRSTWILNPGIHNRRPLPASIRMTLEAVMNPLGSTRQPQSFCSVHASRKLVLHPEPMDFGIQRASGASSSRREAVCMASKHPVCDEISVAHTRLYQIRIHVFRVSQYLCPRTHQLEHCGRG